ncbi:hypothetical protein [Maribellus maritimus]|uniref:hypothetical protein n=1 Tax=Maribellus maritimus TaxID=2870838 RepID=UPI001EEB0331|nr:hypothetical protein [Maribellus maritimus]MCG6191254.1 hypothetical protein [Maribellus maritimus]
MKCRKLKTAIYCSFFDFNIPEQTTGYFELSKNNPVIHQEMNKIQEVFTAIISPNIFLEKSQSLINSTLSD